MKISGVPARLRSFLWRELRKAEQKLKLVPGRDSGTPVHEARKSIKKLRAALRLAAKMFEKGRLRKAKSRLRAAAHFLAPLRDSKVLKKTVSDLRKRNEPVPKQAKPPSVQASLRKARKKLKKAESALHDLPWGEIDHQAWRAGFKRLYRRARRAMRKADSSRSDEDLHAWRRRTKDFYYALGLLNPDDLPGGTKALKETEQLADHLGDDHDLAFFEQQFSSSRDRKTFQPLFRRAKKRRQRLQKKAFQVGRRLFDL